ncbi:hypothetical protein [Heyndrickxia vini]|uniref:Uncharacterized protein n=1 Tax=Heyndrickxia vini TaxID=1476025 RepID=A0ABX7E107_9BACI|nr:hypothetical protein [Heyndrickxia vini]QQZ09421.1 hypothetical protein I5776_21120 [Heyndrickxia vini]
MSNDSKRQVRADAGYVTRPQATELIAKKKGLTDQNQEFHQIYRQIGRDIKSGTLSYEELGGGRIVQIQHEKLVEYAKKYYDVDLNDNNSSSNMTINASDIRTLQLIKNVVELYNENIITDKNAAFDSILKILLQHE